VRFGGTLADLFQTFLRHREFPRHPVAFRNFVCGAIRPANVLAGRQFFRRARTRAVCPVAAALLFYRWKSYYIGGKRWCLAVAGPAAVRLRRSSPATQAMINILESLVAGDHYCYVES